MTLGIKRAPIGAQKGACPGLVPRSGHAFVPQSGHLFVTPGQVFVPQSGHLFVPRSAHEESFKKNEKHKYVFSLIENAYIKIKIVSDNKGYQKNFLIQRHSFFAFYILIERETHIQTEKRIKNHS